MIDGISSLVVIALFIEAFISYLKTIWDERRVQWQIVLAFFMSALFCYDTGLNLFHVIGLTERFPIVGILATSLVLCRGSNYFFEFYNQLSTWRNRSPQLMAENTSSEAMPYTTEIPEDTKPVMTDSYVVKDIQQEDIKATK